MGSGGGIFDSNDIFDPIRMNQKTRFVGSGLQASTFITSPQVGQMCFSTANEGLTFPPAQNYSFLKEKITTRNSAGTTWKVPHINTSTEYTDLDTYTSLAIDENVRYYRFVTLPTSEKFYIIHSITDVKFGADVSDTPGTVTYQFGIDLVESTSPTINSSLLVGISPQSSVSVPAWGGGNVTVSQNIITDPIRGGSVIGVWGICSVSGSTKIRDMCNGGVSQKKKASGFVIDYSDSTAWAAGAQFAGDIAYYGYS